MNSSSLLSWAARTRSAIKIKQPFSTPTNMGFLSLNASYSWSPISCTRALISSSDSRTFRMS